METTNNYLKKWQAIEEEMNAHADKLNAEHRLKYNDAMENFKKEAKAGGDWLEADWDQFSARVKKWWNELQIEIKE